MLLTRRKVEANHPVSTVASFFVCDDRVISRDLRRQDFGFFNNAGQGSECQWHCNDAGCIGRDFQNGDEKVHG